MAAYFLINKQNSIAENVIEWDGDNNNWSPPDTHLAAPVDTTPAIDWVWDASINEWVSVLGEGNGGIGDSWDGQKLIAQKPIAPPDVPVSSIE